MSEEEDLDWASEEDEEQEHNEDDEQVGDDDEKKKGTKQQLTFGEFWEVPLLVAAAGGDERACAAALGRLAAAGDPFPDMPTLAKAVETACAGVETAASHNSARQANEDTQVLLNLMYAPRHSRLHSVAKTLARLENLSHILAWASCAPDGPGAVSSDQRGSSARERMLAQAIQAPRGCPSFEMVELPRLKLSFMSRLDEDGTMRLFSMDHANLFVSNTRDPRAVKLIAGIPNSLLVANAQGEVSILVSVWKVARPAVQSHPFSTSLVLNHASGPWNAAQDQHYFLYPIHVSMSFLMPRGLTSAMYLLLLRLLHRNYSAAFRLAESIASDSSFENSARHMWTDLGIANNDFHPDCQACREKLALVTIDSGEGTPWDLTDNQSRLAVKSSHISCECRVSREEELQLLSSDRMVTAADNRFYRPQLHTLYRMAIVKNRLAALATIASRAGSAGDACTIATARARCWAPPREPDSNWPNYQDNAVFGEKYNSVINIQSPEDLSTQLAESDDASGDLGGPMLTVLCFYVDWSEASLKQEARVREAAPAIPFVRFLSIRADHTMKGIVRDYGVTDFPTWVLMRGSKEVCTDNDADASATEQAESAIRDSRVVGSDEEANGGRTVGFEELKELIDRHVTVADRAAHATRELIAEEARRAARGYADDEALEELQWIWDADMAGMSMSLGQKGMLAELPQMEIEDSSRARWEFCKDSQGQEAQNSVEMAVHKAKSMTWIEYDASMNEQLEQMWKDGMAYTGAMQWQTADGGKQSHANTNTGQPLLAFEHNMVCGLVEYSHNTGQMIAIRRLGKVTEVPNMPSISARDKAVLERVEVREKMRNKQMLELRKARLGKDVEVTRGTCQLQPGCGVTSWRLEWGHLPGRSGESDAVGVSSCNLHLLVAFLF